jgi:hypothetical protein
MVPFNDFNPPMHAGTDTATGDRPAAPEQGDALYVCCLARARFISSIRGTGVDGEHALELIPVRDVVAVVSVVRADDFRGTTADVRMRDLNWIGPRVCRHEKIVELAMRSSPVVPARFATLFSSRASLLAWLETHHVAIGHALDRFAEHQEWAVKGTMDKCKAEGRLVAAALARGARAVSPGTRYLEERRIRAAIGRELSVWVKERCERMARQLLDHAVEIRERTVRPAGTEGEGTPILNWAFLIASESVGEFRACIERINAAQAEHGIVIGCSGPWPPYSFCPSFDTDLRPALQGEEA